MKKRTLFLIVFRTMILSLILSLFSISFIAKKYDPSEAFLNYVYDTEEIITNVKLSIKVEDERDIYDYKLIKSEFAEDLTTFNTYKYINDVLTIILLRIFSINMVQTEDYLKLVKK